MIALGAGVFCVLAHSVLACDMDRVRRLNNMADWAVEHWDDSISAPKIFHRTMRQLLALNRQGCALPAEDPDSVLFRQGAPGLPEHLRNRAPVE